MSTDRNPSERLQFLVGKTIAEVGTRSASIVLMFTDGSAMEAHGLSAQGTDGLVVDYYAPEDSRDGPGTEIFDSLDESPS